MDGINDIAAEWSDLGLERERAVIGAVLSDATVGPGSGPRNRFDPDRSGLAGAPSSGRTMPRPSVRDAHRLPRGMRTPLAESSLVAASGSCAG